MCGNYGSTNNSVVLLLHFGLGSLSFNHFAARLWSLILPSLQLRFCVFLARLEFDFIFPEYVMWSVGSGGPSCDFLLVWVGICFEQCGLEFWSPENCMRIFFRCFPEMQFCVFIAARLEFCVFCCLGLERDSRQWQMWGRGKSLPPCKS